MNLIFDRMELSFSNALKTSFSPPSISIFRISIKSIFSSLKMSSIEIQSKPSGSFSAVSINLKDHSLPSLKFVSSFNLVFFSHKPVS